MRPRPRPRTSLPGSRSQAGGSTRNRIPNRESLFSNTGQRQSSVNRHVITGNRPTFRRPQVVDYDDYDYYYDYEDTDLQSSQDLVPNFITVTHAVPLATVVPVVNGGRTEFRDILTTSPSLEVIQATELKSTDVNNSPVIYANVNTRSPRPGVKEILFDALRATETTSITFTPTRLNLGFGILGRKTSVSHIVPTTIYNIETITTSIVEPVDQNQLLNSLLQQILLGGQLFPSSSAAVAATIGPKKVAPFIPAIPVIPAPPPIQATEFVTHSSTYVTTITSVMSTVLPITLRGKVIRTTLVDSSESVITATEFSTETIINTTPIPIPPPQVLPKIVPTAAPALDLAPTAANGNPLIAQLLPALLQAQLAGQQQDALLKQQQESLLQQQAKELLLQQQQEALLQQQQQEALLREQEAARALEADLINEQLLAQINLDDYSDEDLASLDLEAIISSVINSEDNKPKAPINFPPRNLFDDPPGAVTVQPQIEPSVATQPQSSVITIYKSGARPGEFSTSLKTVIVDNRRKRRDIRPSRVEVVQVTRAPRLDAGWINDSLEKTVDSALSSEMLIQSGFSREIETLNTQTP